MGKIDDYTKAPRADEPSLDISEHLRGLQLSQDDNSKLRISNTGTNNTSAQHEQNVPILSWPRPSGSRNLYAQNYPSRHEFSQTFSTQPNRHESSDRLSQVYGTRGGGDEDERSERVRAFMRRYNRNPRQLVLSPGRDSSRAHQDDAPGHRSHPVFQFGGGSIGRPGVRVDDHSALRSKEYIARCNKHPIPPLPFLNAPSYAQTVSKPSHDPNIATNQTYVGTFPAVDSPKAKLLDGTCPENFPWDRMAGGYRCQGGSHFVTDQLLAEGKGGILIGPWTPGRQPPAGPYYLDPKDGGYHYAGTKPDQEQEVHWPWTHPRNSYNMRYGMGLPGVNGRPALSGPQMVGMGGIHRQNMGAMRFGGAGERGGGSSLVRQPPDRGLVRRRYS